MKFRLLLLFIGIVHCSFAQSVEGRWKTFDIFDPTVPESVVEIKIVEEELLITIVEIIPEEHRNDVCRSCPGKLKDQPILGMTILQGARNQKGVWKGARILNAKNGRYYGCHISVENPDLLKVRGFVGYPVFGKNLYWTRVKDPVYR